MPGEMGARKTAGPGVVLVMLAMVAFPTAVTLYQVHPAVAIAPGANPTPHGYTWSLLLFIVPIVVILLWLRPQEHIRLPKRAFWRTIAILVPAGCALDFFCAHRFFIFPNPGATLGIGAPALGGPVPIEEYVFYFTGFVAILLIYIWLSEFWLAAYAVSDYAAGVEGISRLVQFHLSSTLVGAALIAAAILYKKMFAADHAGFPWYFIVLVAGGLVPASGFFPSARAFINWRALSLTLFYVVLVSLLWEATLALPYGWWGYQSPAMVGISVTAWSNLPIEAACVWMAVGYGTVIIFEIVKLWQASQRSTRETFFGARRADRKRAAGSGS